MSKLIYLTDRSRIDTREDCERKRYLNYDFDVEGEAIGIQRRSASLPLLNGTEIHEAHARLLANAAGFPGAEKWDLESIVEDMKARYRKAVEDRGVYGEVDLEGLIREQTALLEAMLRTFARTWLPRILADYDVVTIEQPMDWEMAPGLVQKLRFDTVLRRKGDGQLVILDYKSMAYISDAWQKKLERATQTSLYITAAEELFGEPVEMAYIGMAKGQWKKETAQAPAWSGEKIQLTPYLYAYANTNEIGTIYRTKYTNAKGFKKIRTYEHMTVAEWVSWLFNNERSLVDELFTFMPPFSPTPAERNRRVELIVREELRYIQQIRDYEAMKREALETGNEALALKAQKYLDFVAAPMRENSCFKYGASHTCPFYDVCFNEGALEYVLEDGAFVKRDPHHSTELEEAA